MRRMPTAFCKYRRCTGCIHTTMSDARPDAGCHSCLCAPCTKACSCLQAQKQVAGDMLRQVRYATSQAVRRSTKLTDASKGVLEQRFAQWGGEATGLLSSMADLGVTDEESVKVSVICSIASTHPAANLPVLTQNLVAFVLKICCYTSSWAIIWHVAISSTWKAV